MVNNKKNMKVMLRIEKFFRIYFDENFFNLSPENEKRPNWPLSL